MRIAIATPAARGSHKGNRVTALRWAGHLRALGHRVGLVDAWAGERCDLLVALHATKSHASVLRWREARPGAPLVVGMAGTDLYQDLPASPEARRSLALATRVTVLQARGVEALPPEIRPRARVIEQSAVAAPPTPPPDGVFRACLLAHVRAVKDAFVAAAAARRLPARSRLQVAHLGAALDPDAAPAARAEMAANPRYLWLGEHRRREALSILAGSQVLVITSRLEGGSNALSEAVAAGVPVLSTRIDGTVGLLGPDHPGYFPVGDPQALAGLLLRAEEDPAFLVELRRSTARARPLVEPAREREAWRRLLAELFPG
ncbi:glycosyl transferase group 1 [Anaeromyxobacter sp. K]|uniref:selenoneine biosynthesis selenosugar synthase SenB n=1 Tax=Anaeromyxobacter sp. (strain K) TaxID=447217 RepID=UPI00015F8892|nr:selenoneine biosynthesis selenosugar synthase SenB [Anaeromyxobacter sp. K]ACG72895.1 glycosyl transferase group 1 [Anaeromyxobacter sp. K]